MSQLTCIRRINLRPGGEATRTVANPWVPKALSCSGKHGQLKFHPVHVLRPLWKAVDYGLRRLMMDVGMEDR
jgi:hypothetical protein